MKLLSLLALALASLMALSLTFGDTALSPLALFGGDKIDQAILLDIRLPRILLAALIGGSLGLAGAALQGYLRNPLADAGILGISAASGFGAVVALYFGLGGLSLLLIPGLSLVAALVATGLILFIARRDTGATTLILAGLGVSSLMGSLTALTMSLAPTPMSLQDMMFWLMGSLMGSSWTEVVLVLPFIGIGSLLLYQTAPALRLLSLGQDVAQTMGVPLQRLKITLVVGTALVVAAGVSVAGIIGFIGLIVPHMMRPLVGYDPGKLLPPSFLSGAIVLVTADMIARTPHLMSELRIGVITALIGTPIFLLILIKSRQEIR